MNEPALMTPGEVAAVFRVNAKTVTRWARAGKLNAVRTLGGHRRFPRADVDRLLAEGFEASTQTQADLDRQAEIVRLRALQGLAS